MKIFDVIKYNGTDKTILWKSPITDMNVGSVLVVNEFQKAIFVKGGRICDILGSGSYELNTDNLPILSRMVNFIYNKKSPFSAEVYFLNISAFQELKWGTSSAVMLEDPKYNIIIPVRSYGQYSIRILDAKLFFTEMASSRGMLTTDEILSAFKGVLLTHINSLLSNYLIKNKVSVLEINAYLPELSKEMLTAIKPDFLKYGVELIDFYVQSVNFPENDSSVKALRQALSRKSSMDILGTDHKTERSYDTAESMVKNNGTMGAGVGLGAGVSIGEALGDIIVETIKNKSSDGKKQVENDRKFCRHCGKSIPSDSKFCSECGEFC